MPMTDGSASVGLLDAHCHLQDSRLAPFLPEILATLQTIGLRSAVVNGTREADWSRTLELAATHPFLIPSLGLHPWHVRERTQHWGRHLAQLVSSSRCGIGEIGLDRWMQGYDSPEQESVFVEQLELAARLDRPVSIHCLRAWGRMLEILKSEPRPACGFLLHSYGGPVEMVRPFAEVGAYFSISGYFAHSRKQRQREVFREIPSDRLLIETDAPDMVPPAELQEFSLSRDVTRGLNHPGNIRKIYGFVADFLSEPVEQLRRRVDANFQRLFGRLTPAST